MLNIFNLFLFLFALWVLLIVGSDKISWLYVYLGIFASLMVSIFSYQAKMINKKSQLLFLSLGFYRHFFLIYIKNFIDSIYLIIELATKKKSAHPTIHKIKINRNKKINYDLLMFSLTMTSGLVAVENFNDEITIHAIDEKFFQKLKLEKIYKSLENVNDDDLV